MKRISVLLIALLMTSQSYVSAAEPLGSFQVLYNVTATKCNGSKDGQFAITRISGGTAPYNVALDDTPYDYLNGPRVMDLAGGAHILDITDSSQPGIAASMQIFIPEPTPIQVAYVTTPLSSADPATGGSITITKVTGGTLIPGADYMIMIDATPVTVGQKLDVGGGAHTITVMDSNTCAYSTQALITKLDAEMQVIFSTKPVTKNGTADGSVTVTAINGGKAPYTVTIDKMSFPPVSLLKKTIKAAATRAALLPVNITLPNLPQGTYIITVTDANGAVVLEQATVNEPDAFQTAYNATGTSNPTANNGSITVTSITGGTPPYTPTLNGLAPDATTPTSFTWNNLSSGAQTLTIVDSVGATVSQQILLAAGSGLNLSLTATSAICNGTATGTISGTISGGTAPYAVTSSPALTFTITPPVPPATQTSFSATAVPAGSYIITVTDSSTPAIVTTQSIVVSDPDPFTVAFGTTAVTCNGTATGTISINNITGGTPPYTLTLDGTQIATDLTPPFTTTPLVTVENLTAGAHTLTVIGAGGCNSSFQIDVREPDPFNVEFSVTNVTCFGGNNGTILIPVGGITGGVAPYIVTIDDRPVTLGTALGGFTAGAHTLTIMDSNQCTSSSQIFVNEPDPVEVVFSTTRATCNGVANGSITISDIRGGTAPFASIAIDGVTLATNVTPPFAPALTTGPTLAAGPHTLTITNSATCVTTLQIFVGEPDPFQLTFEVQDVTCNAGSDGIITVTNIRGGTPSAVSPAYTYTVDGVLPAIAVGSPSQPLKAGPHTVTVFDSNSGCTASQQIIVGQPTNIRITGIKTTHATFPDSSNGSIEIKAEANCSVDYSIFGIDGSFQESPVFKCLPAGCYNVAVRAFPDCGTGCAVGFAKVRFADPLEITTTTTPCSITATVTGGTPPYCFSINNCPCVTPSDVNQCTFPNTFTFTGLCDGNTYTISVLDADNHLSCTSVTIPCIGGNNINQFIQRKDCPCETSCNGSPCSSGSCDGGVCITGGCRTGLCTTGSCTTGSCTTGSCNTGSRGSCNTGACDVPTPKPVCKKKSCNSCN